MKVLQRYLASEIIRSVSFVLVAFLALFAFFDLMGELQSVGKGNYRLQHAFLYVLIRLPGYAYELMPIAALIGTIYVLAQLASRSEFTIMRVSSLSTLKAAGMLAKIGVVFAAATLLFGEFVAPKTSEMAERLRLGQLGRSLSNEFRSGLWARDVIREKGLEGPVVGSRFINARELSTNGALQDLRVFEFDQEFRMTSAVEAKTASYAGNNVWKLSQVIVSRFPATLPGADNGSLLNQAINSRQLPSVEIISEITPEILAVLFADPDRMSAHDLSAYTRHLKENKQRTERYEIAFWKKVIYPLAVFVMMALALPFAYLHFRSGGVSLKIFTGIMIGVSFQLINSLFSHIGLLNTWPPFATAILPSLLFMLIAIGLLWWVERR